MPAIAEPQSVSSSPLPIKTDRLADKIRLRRDFITGKGSLQGLCKQQLIPYGTAIEWYNAEHWLRLKQQHDANDLAKLVAKPEPEQAVIEQQATAKPSVTQQQLDLVNEALLSCEDETKMEKLTRAKLGLIEALHYERTGSRIPSSRQIKQGNKRSQPSVTDSPEQVQSSTEPAKPVADLSSYSAEQLRAALSLACAKEATTSGVQPSPEQPTTPQVTQGT